MLFHLKQVYHYLYSQKLIIEPGRGTNCNFPDTGLAAYLTKWTTPDVLESGAMSGAFFEAYVVAEIIKSYRNAGLEPPLYFYRDRDGNEIDLLIYTDGVLYPIEIKKTSNPLKDNIRAFRLIDGIPGINGDRAA